MSEKRPYVEELKATVLKYKRLFPPDTTDPSLSWFHVFCIGGYIHDIMITEAEASYAFGGEVKPFLGIDPDEPWYPVTRLTGEEPSPGQPVDPKTIKFSDEMLETFQRLVRELPALVIEGTADVDGLSEHLSEIYQICREACREGGMRAYSYFSVLARLSEVIMDARAYRDWIPDLIKKTVNILKPYVPEVEK